MIGKNPDNVPGGWKSRVTGGPMSLLRGFVAAAGILLILHLFAGKAAADRLPLFVSILPQKYFVERIGGDLLDVSVMVPAGASPATYEPKPRQMANLAHARLYFAVGVPFEAAWLGKIAGANPGMEIVHTERGIRKIPMTGHLHGAHDHVAVSAPDHGVLDPHIWLSPPLVMIQARNILGALVEADPDHRALYLAGYRSFIREVVDIDAELIDIFAQKGREDRFMVFHPAWGYFAETYGLEQVPVEIEGKSPKPAQLKRLIEEARKHGIRVIFVQPQFSAESAKVIAREIGGAVSFADPLAPDWPDNLRRQAAKFRSVLK
jgi:zinc transport system substrate-binding protein